MRWWCWGLVLPLVACTVPVEDDPPDVPDGRGNLVVTWSEDPDPRGVLGSPWASSVADAYEMVLTGSGTPQVFTLAAGSGQVVAVTPGTYQLTVLAGVKRSSGSSTALLLGSAVSEGVKVVEGQRTSVSLVLKSLDLGWSTGGGAYWKGPLIVRMAADSRNPRVGMSLAGASTSLRPRFRSGDLWGGYRDATAVNGTPDRWSAEVTGTVPDGSTGVVVEFMGAAVVLLGPDSQWSPTAGLTALTWLWPSKAELSESHPMAGPTTITIPASAPPTGLTLGISWE